LQRQKRKNPVLRTRLPTLPPAARSRVALGLTAAAALGRFELQQCRECGTVQYPPREACQKCLSILLDWKVQPGDGELLAQTVLHHSNDLFFRERLPWRLGLVKLDVGPTVVAHLHDSVAQRVRVRAMLDRAGQAVIVALPDTENCDMADDRQLREFTCDPKHRKIFVTDGKSRFGQEMVHSLARAGAELIWVGYAEPWKKFAGFDELEKVPQVTLVPLDVTDSKNVRELAAEIAGKVDIVVNNAEYHRSFGIANRQGVEAARAEMRPAGVRVVNVFPGPIDDEWNQLLPPPKIAPAALAKAIAGALRDGIEDVYPGDVAQEWLARWRDNPKALERELSA